MIDKVKLMINPCVPLRPEDAIIITKIDWKDFPYEKFKWKAQLHVGGYYFDIADVPTKARDGHFRQNVFYSWNVGGKSPAFYISRVDGYYKIEKYINTAGITDYKTSNIVNRILIKFIRMVHTYRHKPLEELFEVVIAQEELQDL